jgi:hypothetical protein
MRGIGKTSDQLSVISLFVPASPALLTTDN